MLRREFYSMRPKRKQPKPHRLLHSFLSDLMVWLTSLVSNLTVHNVERIPRRGGAIVVANHRSYFDALALASALEQSKRDAMVMAKAELFKNKIVGPLLRKVGVIPVYRGTHRAADSLQDAGEAIRGGQLIALFPEGTIPLDGQLLPFKTGAARLALETGAPVIPVGLVGTELIIKANLKKVKRTLWKNTPVKPSIEVMVGEPVLLEGDSENRESVQAATRRLEAAVEALLPAAVVESKAPSLLRRRDLALTVLGAVPILGGWLYRKSA